METEKLGASDYGTKESYERGMAFGSFDVLFTRNKMIHKKSYVERMKDKKKNMCSMNRTVVSTITILYK